MVITHDRWFLDRIATHILAYEGTDEDPANWYWFEGNFQAYEENKIERLGPDAAKPHRSTYRKLTPGLIVRLHVRRSRCAGPTSTPTRHVNNAEMFRLLEEARISSFWVNDDGTSGVQTAILDARPGADVVALIARQEIEYLAPIPYQRQPIDIELWIGRLGGASLEISYELYSPDGVEPRVLVCEGCDHARDGRTRDEQAGADHR